jgi:hypothetical protein
MQLTYRGAQYEMTASSISTVPGEVIGKYRGAVLMSRRCNFAPPSHAFNLVYRGAHYYPVVSPVQLTGLSNAV